MRGRSRAKPSTCGRWPPRLSTPFCGYADRRVAEWQAPGLLTSHTAMDGPTIAVRIGRHVYIALDTELTSARWPEIDASLLEEKRGAVPPFRTLVYNVVNFNSR
jgi:hypothetical protein